MVDIEKYVPLALRKNFDWKNDDELIRKTKLKYLRQISVMPSGGAKVIDNLTNFFKVPHGDIGTDWVNGFPTQWDLRQGSGFSVQELKTVSGVRSCAFLS